MVTLTLLNVPRGAIEKPKEEQEEEIKAVTVTAVDSSKPREMTLDEFINSKLINLDSAFIKDPETGKFILLRLFIEKYQINLTSQRAIVDPNSSFFAFSPNFVIYTREPKSLDDVIESNELNLVTGKITPDQDKRERTLKEAIESGLLDPETIVVKDSAKNELVNIKEALKQGLVDPERSNVVDTATSKLVSLEKAIEEGLLKTPKKQFDLLEAIQYKLYDTNKGQFVDPFAGAEKEKALVTLEDGIAKGLIDPSTTMVRTSSDSELVPIASAITSGLIDPINGHILTKNPNNDEIVKIDFAKAVELNLLVPAGKRVRFSSFLKRGDILHELLGFAIYRDFNLSINR